MQRLQNELEISFAVDISIEKTYLIERTIENHANIPVNQYDIELGKNEVIKKNEDDTKCFGGVILTNDEGNIICKNTLDVRIDIAF